MVLINQDDDYYRTVSETAEYLGLTEAQVWRRLETGKLQAMFPGDMFSTADGEYLGFRYAMLPPEGVLRIIAWGDDPTTELTWETFGGAAKVIAKGPHKGAIRVFWADLLNPIGPYAKLADATSGSTSFLTVEATSNGNQAEPELEAVTTLSGPGEADGALKTQQARQNRRGLPTKTISIVFGKLTPHHWDCAGWKRNLEDAPAWAKEFRTKEGRKGHGGRQAEWCPFELAKALVEGRAGRSPTLPLFIMNSVFTKREELAPWREEWILYYESRKAHTG